MPATSACCRRARPRRCASCPSATASSRAWRTGSASARSASTTSRRARAHGVTTFSPGRLIGLSIEGLTSFSVAPLRFASLLGVLLAFSAFVFGLTILWEVLDHRQAGAGLSLADDRLDDDRRRAAHHDRHRRRIYRQDPLRAEGAADLLRRRAQREARRWRDRRRAPPSGPPPNERRAPPRRIWLCADDYGISPRASTAPSAI